MTTAADDREGQARLSAFQQGLQQVGGTDGRNVLIDTRWAADNAGVAKGDRAVPFVFVTVATVSVPGPE
jgi:hypothetical protein